MVNERSQALRWCEPLRGLNQGLLGFICHSRFHEAQGSAKRQVGQCSRPGGRSCVYHGVVSNNTLITASGT
jgi:hypothetical protein